jgi:uroporphyrinogen-III synthase
VVESSAVKIASVGPITSKKLKNLGLTVDVTAKDHTIDGLLAEIEETYK